MAGIATATAVAAGSAHSLARLADGTVRAWGDNTKGQLGDGTTNGSTAPVTVLGLQGVDKIAARANGSLARPTQANEQYTYDADGRRVTRSAGGVTWLSLGGGLWEERLGASAAGPGGWVVRQLYTLQGRAVAQQESNPNAINYPAGRVYLHGDHLGSVSVVTDNDRRVLSRQDYTPWGEARGGDITQTTLDFTGQRKDGTGLLYYGARYYDPALGRFLSPDSVAPDKGNPQTRNRYSYVLNNPLKLKDPTGHAAINAVKDFAPPIRLADENPGGGGGENSPADICALRDAEACGQLAGQLISEFGIYVDRFQDEMNLKLMQLIYASASLMSAAFGSAAAFMSAMGGPVHFVYGDTMGGGALYLGAHTQTIRVNRSSTLDPGPIFAIRTIIHEFAHVWDDAERARSGLRVSTRMAAFLTSAGAEVDPKFPSAYAADPNHSYGPEDWAESVAVFVTGSSNEPWMVPAFNQSPRHDFVAQQFCQAGNQVYCP